MKTARSLCAAILALAALSGASWAQDDIKQHPVDLPSAGKSASFKGSLRGDETVDYTFKGTGGQKLRIDFKTGSPSAYFNLLRDGNDEALHIGSIAGARYEGALPSAGNYRVRVYLMRSAARKKAKANYALTLRGD